MSLSQAARKYWTLNFGKLQQVVFVVSEVDYINYICSFQNYFWLFLFGILNFSYKRTYKLRNILNSANISEMVSKKNINCRYQIGPLPRSLSYQLTIENATSYYLSCGFIWLGEWHDMAENIPLWFLSRCHVGNVGNYRPWIYFGAKFWHAVYCHIVTIECWNWHFFHRVEIIFW